jgi:hypothetical protein
MNRLTAIGPTKPPRQFMKFLYMALKLEPDLQWVYAKIMGPVVFDETDS